MLHVNSWDIPIQLVCEYSIYILQYYNYTYNNIGGIINTNGKFGVGNGPIVYSNVHCYGGEKGLFECKRLNNPQFSCYNPYIIGLKCLESKLAIYLYIMSNML